MTTDLLSLKCIAPTSAEPSGYFFIRPKRGSDKLRAIFNDIYQNAKWPWSPKRYSLPNFDSLKDALRSRCTLAFHRTDIKNFYWSFLLPPSFQSAFVFNIRSPNGHIQRFSLLRPPFGWDYIPAIANTVVHSIIQQPANAEHLVYVDDIFTWSFGSADCTNAVNAARHSLLSSGFIIHAPGSDKCSAFPEHDSHFVGKRITSGTSPSISNRGNTTTTALFFAIIGTASALSAKAIACIAGSLQWASIHTRWARPFFYGLHRLACLPRKRKVFLPAGTRAGIVKAAYLCSLPWTPADLTFSRPAHSCFLAFTDAAIATHTASAAFLLQGIPHYMSWPLPQTCASQQQAELYALTRTIRWCISRKEPFCVITDSTSSINSATSLNAGIHSPDHAMLLQQLADALVSLQHPAHLAWVPSEFNPADLPSQFLPYTRSSQPLSLATPPITLENCSFEFPSAISL